MKKGANLWCFPEDIALKQAFSLASHARFDGIEINLEEEGEFSLSSKDQEVSHLTYTAKEYGLEITSISTSLFWTYPLTSREKKIVQKGKEIAKKMIHFAALLEVDTILVVPGVVNEQTSYEEAYASAQEGLLELAETASAHNVTIAVENVWNKFLLSPLEMKRFIEEINHPQVKVYFDVGNVLVSGYPEQWIRILGEHIQKVHVKDFKQEIGNITGFTSLLQGDVNWKAVRKALHEIGYNGYLISEIPPHPSYPEQNLVEISQALDLIIGGDPS